MISLEELQTHFWCDCCGKETTLIAEEDFKCNLVYMNTILENNIPILTLKTVNVCKDCSDELIKLLEEKNYNINTYKKLQE